MVGEDVMLVGTYDWRGSRFWENIGVCLGVWQDGWRLGIGYDVVFWRM